MLRKRRGVTFPPTRETPPTLQGASHGRRTRRVLLTIYFRARSPHRCKGCWPGGEAPHAANSAQVYSRPTSREQEGQLRNYGHLRQLDHPAEPSVGATNTWFLAVLFPSTVRRFALWRGCAGGPRKASKQQHNTPESVFCKGRGGGEIAGLRFGNAGQHQLKVQGTLWRAWT